MAHYDKSMIKKGMFIICGGALLNHAPRPPPRYGDDLDEIKERLAAVKLKIEELKGDK